MPKSLRRPTLISWGGGVAFGNDSELTPEDPRYFLKFLIEDLRSTRTNGKIAITCFSSGIPDYNDSSVVAAVQNAVYISNVQVTAVASEPLRKDLTGFNGLLHLVEDKTISLHYHDLQPGNMAGIKLWQRVETEEGCRCVVRRAINPFTPFESSWSHFGAISLPQENPQTPPVARCYRLY